LVKIDYFFNKIANKKEAFAKITKLMAFIDNVLRNIGNAYFETTAMTNKKQPITINDLDKFFMLRPSFHCHTSWLNRYIILFFDNISNVKNSAGPGTVSNRFLLSIWQFFSNVYGLMDLISFFLA